MFGDMLTRRDWDNFDQFIDEKIRQHMLWKAPKFVHHYTSLKSLEDIISSRAIFAAHYESLEDIKECKLAREHLPDVVTRLRKTQLGQHPSSAHVLGRIVNEYERRTRADPPFNFYISCFCFETEQPHLWESFGRHCSGCCLTFEMLDEQVDDSDGTAALWTPVEYNHERQAQQLYDVIKKLLTELNRYDCSTRESLRHMAELCLNGIGRAIVVCEFRFKRQCYSREQEWRLALWPPRDTKLKALTIGAKRGLLWPFRPNNQLPVVTTVHVGSRADATAEATLRSVLSSQGYGQREAPRMPEIVRSAIACGEPRQE